MPSEAFTQWRAEHAAMGCRVERTHALFLGGPVRWAAFAPNGGEVSAFATCPLRPELDRVVPHRTQDTE